MGSGPRADTDVGALLAGIFTEEPGGRPDASAGRGAALHVAGAHAVPLDRLELVRPPACGSAAGASGHRRCLQTRWLVLDEHTGTHADAPRHFIPPAGSGLPHAGPAGHIGIDKLPLLAAAGPADVVDVTSLDAAAERLAAWQAEHGPIAAGDVLLLRSGWDDGYRSRRDAGAQPGRRLQHGPVRPQDHVAGGAGRRGRLHRPDVLRARLLVAGRGPRARLGPVQHRAGHLVTLVNEQVPAGRRGLLYSIVQGGWPIGVLQPRPSSSASTMASAWTGTSSSCSVSSRCCSSSSGDAGSARPSATSRCARSGRPGGAAMRIASGSWPGSTTWTSTSSSRSPSGSCSPSPAGSAVSSSGLASCGCCTRLASWPPIPTSWTG